MPLFVPLPDLSTLLPFSIVFGFSEERRRMKQRSAARKEKTDSFPPT